LALPSFSKIGPKQISPKMPFLIATRKLVNFSLLANYGYFPGKFFPFLRSLFKKDSVLKKIQGPPRILFKFGVSSSPNRSFFKNPLNPGKKGI